MQLNKEVLIGTTGGTLLTVANNLRWDDILHTAIMAAIGAFVSMVLSILFKWVKNKIKRRFE